MALTPKQLFEYEMTPQEQLKWEAVSAQTAAFFNAQPDSIQQKYVQYLYEAKWEQKCGYKNGMGYYSVTLEGGMYVMPTVFPTEDAQKAAEYFKAVFRKAVSE